MPEKVVEKGGECRIAVAEDLLSYIDSCAGSEEGEGRFRRSCESIHTIAEHCAARETDVSKFQFEVFETETPGRGVSSVFIFLYSLLGLTILTLIILTVVFDFGMMLLLVMTIIIFVIIVILTNTCTMVYQL